MLRRLGQHALDIAEREVGGVAVEIFGIERADRRLSRRHGAQQIGVGDAAAAERHDGEAELAAAVRGDAVGEALHGATLGPRRPEAGMHRPDGRHRGISARRRSLGPEQPVAGIAQAGHDVGVIVEALVEPPRHQRGDDVAHHVGLG